MRDPFFVASAAGWLFWHILIVSVSASAEDTEQRRDLHPLMPGLRSTELNDMNWPRTYHDKLVTGFSPLTCGMSEPPSLWSTIHGPTTVDWVQTVEGNGGHQKLLVYDGSLRLVSPEGCVLWTNSSVTAARSANAAVLHFGDLRANGRDSLLIGDGHRLSLIDGATGQVEWSYECEPAFVSLQNRPWSLVTADIRPDLPGLEAAVFPLYSDRGYLISFPPTGDPVILWDKPAIVPGEHAPGPGGGERADHGCWTQVDLSDPKKPVIWNVRHHRCRGFDPHTGDIISTLIYDIGGSHKRNYGPAMLGQAATGQTLMCVASEAVQFHVHAIALNRDGPSRLLWEKDYGELLASGKPGRTSLKSAIIDDVDFDGTTEFVYTVVDDARGLRPIVVIRDALTGSIEAEFADYRCERAIVNPGTPAATWLVMRPTAGDGLPTTELQLWRITAGNDRRQVAHWTDATLWGPEELADGEERSLFLRTKDGDGKVRVLQISLSPNGPQIIDRSEQSAVANLSHLATVWDDNGDLVFVGAPVDGALRAFDFQGRPQWTLNVNSIVPGMVSAADLNGDGHAELVATTPIDQRLHAYEFDSDGNARELWSQPHWCSDSRAQANLLGPLLYDLCGDGKLCAICPGQNSKGQSVVCAFHPDGKPLWETVLCRESAGPPTRWHAGDFLPGSKAGVVVSSQAPYGDSILGTFLLDGLTGKVIWQKSGHLRTHRVSLPYYPMGVPTAFDLDGDGVEEIGMDFYCYMAWMNGVDGSFAMLHHTANLGVEQALFAGRFHNSYVPVFLPESPTDSSGRQLPHWFVPLGGHGSVGLMKPDPTQGIWRDELGYDMPLKVGMVDVDGDGRLEVGYTRRSGLTFFCRDLITGDIEWELELPEVSQGPVITADFDGDGRGEFFCGRCCLGTNKAGQGEIRWTMPETISWPVIADLNGDGIGEIAGFGPHGIHVLKGGGDAKP